MISPGDRISTRFLAAALAVAALVLGIVAIGVLRVGATAFEAVMMAAGATAEHAHAMFDESVTGIFLVAAAVAVVTARAVAHRHALAGRHVVTDVVGHRHQEPGEPVLGEQQTCGQDSVRGVDGELGEHASRSSSRRGMRASGDVTRTPGT